MPVSVRRARPDDLDTIVEFNRLLAEETEGKALDSAILRRGVAALLNDPARGIYFVAERQGQIVGQLMITSEWSDWRDGWMWWIQSVYVDRAWRRQGIFRSLYRHVEATARETPGVIGLRLYVERHNEPAQQTYLKLGMTWTDYLVLEKHPL